MVVVSDNTIHTSNLRIDGVNWYAYVSNNPLMWVDPTGSRQGRDTDDDVAEARRRMRERMAEQAKQRRLKEEEHKVDENLRNNDFGIVIKRQNISWFTRDKTGKLIQENMSIDIMRVIHTPSGESISVPVQSAAKSSAVDVLDSVVGEFSWGQGE